MLLPTIRRMQTTYIHSSLVVYTFHYILLEYFNENSVTNNSLCMRTENSLVTISTDRQLAADFGVKFNGTANTEHHIGKRVTYTGIR